jgi:predicted DsbA family dithiol-disulfide isomerase
LPITIDVVQDTVCPWCRIGKKNLDDALKHFDGETGVRFHPYFLRPEMPQAGRDFREHMRAIKGDDDIEPMLIRVSNTGLQAGLTFNWDKVKRMPNSLLSHALILSAPVEAQGRVLDAVHQAYFVDGKDIGKKETLIEISDGLPVDITKLDDEAFLDEVAGRAEAAQAQGITGVPFFIIDGQVGISGAQPPSVLLEAMEEAVEARRREGAEARSNL